MDVNQFDELFELKKQYDEFKKLDEKLSENANNDVLVSDLIIHLTGASTYNAIHIDSDKDFNQALYLKIYSAVHEHYKYLGEKIKNINLVYKK